MGAEISFSGSKNVICRYIRFRQGLASGENKKNAVGMHDAHGIILDHVSIQFGRWDTVDVTASSDVTIQYSIIGPGVAPQRFGCLCESDGVTFSHDLWINNHSRNPKSKGKVQFINNVVYNWELDAYIAGASAGKNWHDVIGNYFIAGPVSKHGPFARGNENTQIFAQDNDYDDNRNGVLDGEPVPNSELGPVTLLKAPFPKRLSHPIPRRRHTGKLSPARLLAASRFGRCATHRRPHQPGQKGQDNQRPYGDGRVRRDQRRPRTQDL